jgi:hypothetical protein
MLAKDVRDGDVLLDEINIAAGNEPASILILHIEPSPDGSEKWPYQSWWVPLTGYRDHRPIGPWPMSPIISWRKKE